VSETALEAALSLMKHTKEISDAHFEIRIPTDELEKRSKMTISESWISFSGVRKRLTPAQTFLHRLNEISGCCTNLSIHFAKIDKFRISKKRWGREESLKLIIRDFVHEAYSLHEVLERFGKSGKDLISDKNRSSEFFKCIQKLCVKLKRENVTIYNYRNYLVHRELGLQNPFSFIDSLSIGAAIHPYELAEHFENEILKERKKWSATCSYFNQCTFELVSKIIETNNACVESGQFDFT
jgi:hypothetical protein